MTTDEKRIALAKWMGWTFQPMSGPLDFPWVSPSKKWEDRTAEPPPLTLDWLHECEKKLTVNQLPLYIHYLVSSVNIKNDKLAFDWVKVHATKEQRLDALVATLGLKKKE